MNHPKVLGITRHDGIYNESRLLSASDKKGNNGKSRSCDDDPLDDSEEEEEEGVFMKDRLEKGESEDDSKATPPIDEVRSENEASPPVIKVAGRNEASSPFVEASRPVIDVAGTKQQTSCASIDEATKSGVPGSELCPLMIE